MGFLEFSRFVRQDTDEPSEPPQNKPKCSSELGPWNECDPLDLVA
jgi:hypothetical protein